MDSRSLYGISSVNSYDQIIKQIIEVTPSWEKDGGGIRGRTIAPILSGLSSSGFGDPAPQIFNQQSNQTIQRSAGDPISDLTLDGGSGTAAVTSHPFKITSTPNENGYTITVAAGTINGVLPTNWNISESISQDQLKYCVLNVSASSNRITNCSLSLDSSPPTSEMQPVKWGLPSTFQVLIGLIYNSQTYNTIITSISYQAIKRITTEKQTIEVGEIPYDNWYVWQLVAQ